MAELLPEERRAFIKEMQMRFGIATGEVISGIIGKARPVFDTWGRTVNLASRLESTSPHNGISIDARTALALDERFEIFARGRIYMKGIGETEAFLLERRECGAGPTER